MTKRIVYFLALVILLGILLAGPLVGAAPQPAAMAPAANSANPCAKLPAPNEAELYPWLAARCYVKLYDEKKSGWTRDKEIRGTGPYIAGNAIGLESDLDYGVHPAVRIYYSPEVMTWLKGGRKGAVADGGIIVKEMYYPPNPSYYNTLTPEEQVAKMTSWTIMVKAPNRSYDGWFWSYYAVPEPPAPTGLGATPPAALHVRHDGGSDARPAEREHLNLLRVIRPIEAPPPSFPYDTNSGFGLYCLRCHASATNEATFSSLDNIEGFPGEVLTYLAVQPVPTSYDPGPATCTPPVTPPPASAGFLKTFQYPTLDIPLQRVKSFPSAVYDHVVVPQKPDLKMQFITSDQCMGCHDATEGEQWNPHMMTTEPITKTRLNYSVNGEWQSSVMGLSGRDPIFHAQLESETLLIPALRKNNYASNVCYRCHGAMGQKQLQHDTGRTFPHDLVYQFSDDLNRDSEGDLKYGALARDGISCAVCHHIDLKSPTKPVPPTQFTGEFLLMPSNIVNGPFPDPLLKPMNNTLGYTPQQSPIIKSAGLCGTCHSIVLPVFKADGSPVIGPDGKPKEGFEQSTYPEWLNSAYQNEDNEHRKISPGQVRTCQSCHMPNTMNGSPIAFRIANIEDNDYPMTTHRLPEKDITLPIRSPFSRHLLIGINQFVLNMFSQFSSILGNSLTDAMAPGDAQNPIQTTMDASLQVARNESVRLTLTHLSKTDKSLEVGVNLANLTGHKFPTGVGFRRAFLELDVLDASGRVLWASGRTNSEGVIIGGDGKPLITEFFDARHGNGTPPQKYQHHHKVVTSQDEVQIYERLDKDPAGFFTTSFFSLDKDVKDNRLLPLAWSSAGLYAEVTKAVGVDGDPDYENGTGSDSVLYQIAMTPQLAAATQVQVKVMYQATPPYYLVQRFDAAAGAPPEITTAETKRLYYLGSHLDTSVDGIQSWRTELASVSSPIAGFSTTATTGLPSATSGR
ncbi:MAG TPA: hypothetical protein VEZ11_10810 [Thermoanaerobaculia bacterium]|nr:hypothetical protein [Thermoanaerobaculia bacterium]